MVELSSACSPANLVVMCSTLHRGGFKKKKKKLTWTPNLNWVPGNGLWEVKIADEVLITLLIECRLAYKNKGASKIYPTPLKMLKASYIFSFFILFL